MEYDMYSSSTLERWRDQGVLDVDYIVHCMQPDHWPGMTELWTQAREWFAAKCTVPRAIVCVLLMSFLVIWSSALHAIDKATHLEERAAIETPPTMWSAKRVSVIPQWKDWHGTLVEEAAAYEPASPYDARSRLVLMGDSITELWRGSQIGEPSEKSDGVPQVLQETLARRWPNPLVLGINGDQTQHLLWRISHGEVSSTMAADRRLMIVLLIGTNNLYKGHEPEEVAEGILAVARRLLNITQGKLLVNALFPRGDGARLLPPMCPPRCNANGKPLHSFMPAIGVVNRLVNSTLSKQLAAEYPARVRYVDCGRVFLPQAEREGGSAAFPGGTYIGRAERAGGGGAHAAHSFYPAAAISQLGGRLSQSMGGRAEEVALDLLPDRLHPGPAGYRLWAECLEEALTEFEEATTPWRRKLRNSS